MTCTIIPETDFLGYNGKAVIFLPYFSCKVAAGFPSPADDHLDNPLSLSDLLIKHPAATFFARATGASMQGVGIYDGDFLVIDKSLKAVNGSVIIAAIDGGDCMVKTLRKDHNNRIWLQSENAAFPPIHIRQDTTFEVWGVVVGVVRVHGDHGRVRSC